MDLLNQNLSDNDLKRIEILTQDRIQYSSTT